MTTQTTSLILLVAPFHLRTEHLIDPLGLDIAPPRFGWWVGDQKPGAVQTAYEVEVGSGDLIVWASGKVQSDQSVDVVYGGSALLPATGYRWRVRTWDADDRVSGWSDEALFETGCSAAMWDEAKWIGYPRDADTGGACVPVPYFRTEFEANSQVIRARLYVVARGVVEVSLNGLRVGRDEFAPGWSDFKKHYQAVAYDVTSLVQPGANALGAILGDGWFAGRQMSKNPKHYFGDSALKMRLHLEYADGRTSSVVTDEHWSTATGPIIQSDFYNGESYDARLEMPGWSTAAFDRANWIPVVVRPDDGAAIVAKIFPPVRQIEILKPLSSRPTAESEIIYDFGQNMVGYVGFRLHGKEGQVITLRFAEMLNPDQTLYVENLRSAVSTDEYTFGEDGVAAWHPKFTFHGFRYLGLTGADAIPALDSIDGIVLHTDMEQTGSFSTSNAMVNQLQSNIRWGQRGNFLEAPTDCPQRDERLGWTGDAQVFARTATFSYDVNAFFEKWMMDMRDGQGADGQFPDIAPNLGWSNSSPAWGDAGVIVPWVMYQQYGNTKILADNLDAMRRWVDWQELESTDDIRSDAGYGDWLALDKGDPENPTDSDTPRPLIGTAYFAYTARLVSKMAGILGITEVAAHYDAIFERVRGAFQRKFIDPNGRITGHTQTVYLLALGFDLMPEALRTRAADRLVADIKAKDWHLSTGFVGTGLLMPVLNSISRNDVAFRLLMQETFPGWFYSIHQGATTMWERWNSYTLEKGFGLVDMNSFNHYAYGAVGEWMYSVIGGITAAEPGFKKILIQPNVDGGITHSDCRLNSPYGPIHVVWHLDGNPWETECQFHLIVDVPANTTAQIILPLGDRERHEAGAGRHEYHIDCKEQYLLA